MAFLIIAAKQMEITTTINGFLSTLLQGIDSLGFWGILIFIGVYILATVFFLPGSILTLGAGAIFGLMGGSVLVSLASTLGATVAFLIGRYLARGWVRKQIEKRPNFKAIDNAVAQEGWKIVGLTRLSPIFPFVFLNYAFGVTQVSLKDYILASWLGMMPGTILYVYIGSLTKNLATLGTGNEPANTVQWLIRIIGFMATVGVTVYVTKIAKKALNNQMTEQDKTDFQENDQNKTTQLSKEETS